ncbi:MAG: carboxymuconolactone decarboxylase family protein [Xanthobacteraceae bacterium]|jgi:4-carboxymuconolactone decarboxylase
MARIDEVKKEELTPRQKKLHDDISRTRGGRFGGPFPVWIRTPDIAEHADRLTNCFRANPKLDRRLIELIVLLVSRDATAKYAWSVHVPNGLKEGLTQETVDAIRARRRPDFKRDDERLIYDFVTELLATKTVSAASFERMKAAFGLDGVIEAVTCAGCYGMIGLVLNVFDIPPRPGYPLT